MNLTENQTRWLTWVIMTLAPLAIALLSEPPSRANSQTKEKSK